MHYTGTLEDGTKFDSSVDRGDPFSFTLGQGQVIKGWDETVATMKKGEKCRVVLRSDYAYGKQGSPPKIPADATLVFEIELLSWRSVKDLTGDGGVIKNAVSEGEGWESPSGQDEVHVSYTAYLKDDPERALAQTPEEGRWFSLEDGAPCAAVALAAKAMRKGGEAVLEVRPPYAAGLPGCPDGETLCLRLRLLDWRRVERLGPNDQVVKKTLRTSEQWETPAPGSRVRVALAARAAGGGEPFDAHGEDAPLEWVLDADEVPEGLDLAVGRMKQGEVALITAPADLAYACLGAPEGGFPGLKSPEKPEECAVEWEVTLLQVVRRNTWEMSPAEKLEASAAAKALGNSAFKAGAVQRALARWARAEEGVRQEEGFGEADKTAARALKASLALNLAAGHARLGDFSAALKAADRALGLDAQSVKALYRRAQARTEVGDYAEADEDIKRGLQLEPESLDFKRLRRRWKEVAGASVKKEASLYASMFRDLGKGGSETRA